jgi:hypothetical protein
MREGEAPAEPRFDWPTPDGLGSAGASPSRVHGETPIIRHCARVGEGHPSRFAVSRHDSLPRSVPRLYENAFSSLFSTVRSATETLLPRPRKPPAVCATS